VTTNTLPFKQLPNWLIVEIMNNALFWINCFPHKDGIHNTLHPQTIVTGSKIDFNNHCKLEFGTYVDDTTGNSEDDTMGNSEITGVDGNNNKNK